MVSNANRETMTLNEIGELLMKAILKLSEEERKRLGACTSGRFTETSRKIREEQVEGMSEPKMGPTQYKAEIERLQREGKMPSLEAVLAAVAETRAE